MTILLATSTFFLGSLTMSFIDTIRNLFKTHTIDTLQAAYGLTLILIEFQLLGIWFTLLKK